MIKSLLEKISKWRDRIGYKPALIKLRDSGISNSMAEKLLAGTYASKPNPIFMKAIETAMSSK